MSRRIGRPHRRLLIVSASAETLFSTQRYFTLRGFQADGTRSPQRAAALIADRHYGVVLVCLGRSRAPEHEWIAKLQSLLQHLPEETFVLCTTDSSNTDDQAVRHQASTCVESAPPRQVVQAILALLSEVPEDGSTVDRPARVSLAVEPVS